MESEEQKDLDNVVSRGSATRFGRRGRKSLYEAPEFTKRLSAFIEAQAGEDVTFECGCKGFPVPTLRWYRDDEALPGDERYLIEESAGYASLSIAKVGKNDEAAYKCKAENSEGVTSTTGYLSVTGDNSEKPLSCQGRQSDHAVSNPPPLRTIIEQKSMEEREEDSYPQPSTSPVDEILEEAALKGQGWPAMFGFKKRKERRQRGNDEDYDSGSDTSVESQQDDRVGRERTPDADLVIDEGDLLPHEGVLLQGDEPQMIENNNMKVQDVVTNGVMMEQVNPGFGDQVTQDMQQNVGPEMQQNGATEQQSHNPAADMQVGQESQENVSCQAPGLNYLTTEPQPIPVIESGGGDVNVGSASPQGHYSEVNEYNITPDMQTAPAMASPNDVHMDFATEPQEPPIEFVQGQQFPEIQEEMIVPQSNERPPVPDVHFQDGKQMMMLQGAQMQDTPDGPPAQLGEVQDTCVQMGQQILEQPEQLQTEHVQDVHMQQPEYQPEFQAVQPDLPGIQDVMMQQGVSEVQEAFIQPEVSAAAAVENQFVLSQEAPREALQEAPQAVAQEVRDDSPIDAKPGTEKQKSLESGYSTEDLDAAIQQEGALTFTETMEVPVVRSSTNPENQSQQATIVLGAPGEALPEVNLGAPVNLEVSLMGQSGSPMNLQIGESQQQMVTIQDHSSEPDGLAQQAPPTMSSEVTGSVSASPQVYESPAHFVSVERREISPQQVQNQQQVVYAYESQPEATNEPHVLPQQTETVMSQQPVTAGQSQERLEEVQSTSASNPFRSQTEDPNEEMLASYTRTFSSTIEEEEQSQEVGEPLVTGEPVVRRHSDEIITLARVSTTLPIATQDSLPFPWLPVSLLVTVSSFLAVAFEISPSSFVLALFFISLIGFRFIVSKQKPKDD